MEWKVAPSYQNATIVKVDSVNKKAYIKETCDRCGGRGIVAARVENGKIVPIPVDGGICYKCGGAGFISKWVKAYTDKEYDAYLNSREKARQKRQQAAEDKKQSLIDNSEANKLALLEEFGYDTKNPTIYMIVGNTYSIKDDLKAKGCHFEKILGWYCSHPIDVPEEFYVATVAFDDIFDWNPYTKRFSIKEGASKVAEAAQISVLPESKSEYIGEVKDRLRDMKVTLTGARTMDGYYGTTTIYTFDFNDNILVWMTSTSQDIEVGDEVLLTGTVKQHKEFRGVKQTQLSRCKITKGA